MPGDVKELLDFIELSRDVEKSLDHFLYSHNHLSIVKALVLRHLLDTKRKINMTDLARATRTERHNITTLAARMERDGLINKQYDAKDRRAVCVSLTEKGKSIARGIDSLLEEAAQVLLPNIREDEEEGEL